MTTLLDVRGLSAGYGRRAVVRDLDLRVEPGEVVGLFGPNGSGKTTTLLTLAGCLPPMAGKVELVGSPLGRGARPQRLARRGVSLVPENRGLFRELTVAQNMRLGHRPRRGRRAAITAVLDVVPALAPLLGRRAGLLSGGEQQMLAVARALLTRPRLLLVDEMSLGLAPLVARALLETLRDTAGRADIGVLLVEQHVPLALRYVDRAYVLHHGDLAFEGTAAALAASPRLISASYLGDTAADDPTGDDG